MVGKGSFDYRLMPFLMVLCVGLAALVWIEHRRLERTEEAITALRHEVVASRSAAGPGVAEPLPPQPPLIGAPLQMIQLDAPHVEPVMAETRLFQENASMTPYQWSAFVLINTRWGDALKTAQKSGESALGHPLADLLREREDQIAKLLSPPQLEQFRALEAKTGAPRIRYAAKDGKTYEAIALQ